MGDVPDVLPGFLKGACSLLFPWSPVQWSASPGRLSDFEDEVFKSTDIVEIPTILAVITSFVDGERTVGAAYVDVSTRRMGACEFHDDMEYCTLETLIVQLGPKECVLPKVRRLFWSGSLHRLRI